MRATALSDATNGQLPFDTCLRGLEEQDRLLDQYVKHEEVVVWSDACLHDQLILVRHLDWFSGREPPARHLSLVCAGAYPGKPNFASLGELHPGELGSLFGTRHEVSVEERDTACAAWSAVCADTPTEVENLLSRGTSALPYLSAALVRFLEQYPSVEDGLSRLQRECLEAVAASASDLSTLYPAVSRTDRPAFFGDTTLWSCVYGLSCAPTPALEIRGPEPFPLWDPPADLSPWSLRLTATGERLLSGALDWIRLCGVDRWIGGVYLSGAEAAWRWHRGRQCLVGR